MALKIRQLSDSIVTFTEIPAATGIIAGILIDEVYGQIPLTNIAQRSGMIADTINGNISIRSMSMAKDNVFNPILPKKMMEGLASQESIKRGKSGVGHREVAVGDKVHGNNHSFFFQLL